MKEEVLTRLDNLAATLKVTTEHLWVVLVQRGTAEGIRALLITLLGWGFVLFALKVLPGECKKISDQDGSNVPRVVAICLIAIVGFIAGCANVSDIFYIFSPEFFAFEQVKGLLG